MKNAKSKSIKTAANTETPTAAQRAKSYALDVKFQTDDPLQKLTAVTPVMQMGLNLMALGVMLTNQDSKIRDISDAATKCGLAVRFGFVKST